MKSLFRKDLCLTMGWAPRKNVTAFQYKPFWGQTYLCRQESHFMNKIIASAGLAALGAANLHLANASGLVPMDKPKPWSISGVVRGFYDDNPTDSFRTAKQESWGVEFSPSLAVNLAFDQTTLGF